MSLPLALLVLSLGACTCADPPPVPGQPPVVADLDVRLEAATTPVTRLLAILDTDGDQRLSAVEFQQVAHGCERMIDHDTDASGFIEPAELEQMLWDVSPKAPFCTPEALENECMRRYCSATMSQPRRQPGVRGGGP